jgi:siroheme synthase
MEAKLSVDQGDPYTITPGVPAFAAAAAALGVELTLPEMAQSLVLTRTQGRASAMPAHEKLAAFAATRTTLGREMRMLVENSDDQTAADPSLLRIIARAHHIQARLIHNTKLTVHDIAREERVSAAYLYSLLRLPWLAPDITTAIINGRKPPQLTAQTLMRLTPRLPANWAEQRQLLGFR